MPDLNKFYTQTPSLSSRRLHSVLNVYTVTLTLEIYRKLHIHFRVNVHVLQLCLLFPVDVYTVTLIPERSINAIFVTRTWTFNVSGMSLSARCNATILNIMTSAINRWCLHCDNTAGSTVTLTLKLLRQRLLYTTNTLLRQCMCCHVNVKTVTLIIKMSKLTATLSHTIITMSLSLFHCHVITVTSASISSHWYPHCRMTRERFNH